MNDLYALAEAVGLARHWRAVDGTDECVSDTALHKVLAALGYPAGTSEQIAQSLARVAQEQAEPPKMIVTEIGLPIVLPASLVAGTITAPDGTGRPVMVEGGTIAPIDVPGYYQLHLNGHLVTLAVAPKGCRDLASFGARKFWGAAVQIPALRGVVPKAFGDFGNLHDAVSRFAAQGADALMVNPVHALFAGNGVGFSPYSPSSRLYLNGAMADPALLGLPALPAHAGGDLIDWETAMPARLADLRAVFDGLEPLQRARIMADCAGNDGLRRHAIYDALDRRFRPQGLRGWRAWPADYHDPAGLAVARFAEEHADEVEFHLFVQWLTGEGLAAVQAGTKDAGMAIGIIADLAVGVDPGGSDAWAMRDRMLDGLTIGAPPDPLGPLGQNWMLSGFSPRGLRESGYAPWIDMLRSALRRAGGLRIDHAFGLARLWVIPDGGGAGDGAYLSYPFEDLLRLAALESHLAEALIIAEDLGTKPYGFADAISPTHMLGMRVMWFERAEDHGFIGPQDYPFESVAMTGTHDTATVAGWWTGRDLDWAGALGRLPEDTTLAQERDRRDWDRGLLWATFGAPGPRPAADDPGPAVTAALRHIGRAGSGLSIAPLEDLLGLIEQPNLPGTITEHPNWRRRLSAPLADLLADPDTAARIAALVGARADCNGRD